MNKNEIFESLKRINTITNHDKYSDEFCQYAKAVTSVSAFDQIVEWIELMQRHINIYDSIVLDAACGFSIHSVVLAHYNNSVTGIDSADHRIADAKKVCDLFYPEYNLKIIKGDITSLICKDNSYDVIYCNEVVSHVYGLHSTLKEFYRVLKPGGRIIITDCDKWCLNSIIQRFIELPGMYDKYYFERRRVNVKEIASKIKLNLDDNTINSIAKNTEGWSKNELTVLLDSYKRGIRDKKKLLSLYKPKFKYRDPDNGMYEERLFARKKIAKILHECGFKSRIIPLFSHHLNSNPMMLLRAIYHKLKGYYEYKYLIEGIK